MAAQRGHTKWGGRKKGVPNKATAEIKAAFREHGDALVKALLKLTKSKDERVRLGAIQAALDRGWGKAVQSMELDVTVPISSANGVGPMQAPRRSAVGSRYGACRPGYRIARRTVSGKPAPRSPRNTARPSTS